MAQLRTCCGERHGYGLTSGTGISGYRMNVYRFPKTPSGEYLRSRTTGKPLMATGDLDGAIFATQEEADAVALERGYIKPYTRNTCGFVMSRAARKRGLTTHDYLYNNRQRRTEDNDRAD